MRHYKLLSAAWIVLTARIAAVETEIQRYELPGGEAIVLSVDKQPGPDFCTLALAPKQGPPIPFWSRKSGEVIEWNDFPGGIRAADKMGDNVAVALGYDDFTIFFVQVNIVNRTETVTGVPIGNLYRELGRFDTVIRVTAPNELSFGNERTGETRVLRWREDGKPYLNGVVYAHSERASETAEPFKSEPGPGLPPAKRISPGAEDSTATILGNGSTTRQQTDGPDWQQSPWHVGLGVIGLLLIAAGAYTLIKRLRQA
jgi:hypothetical protein